jgi:hypothetical protein
MMDGRCSRFSFFSFHFARCLSQTSTFRFVRPAVSMVPRRSVQISGESSRWKRRDLALSSGASDSISEEERYLDRFFSSGISVTGLFCLLAPRLRAASLWLVLCRDASYSCAMLFYH